MSKTHNNPKLEKLRKLLSLGAGTANEAEANAAIAKAAEYARTHGLDIEDLQNDIKRKEASAGYGPGDKLYSAPRTAPNKPVDWAPADAYLLSAIATFCECKAGTCLDEDGDNAVQFFGHEVDVELAQYLRRNINKAFTFEAGAYYLTLDSEFRAEHWAKPSAIDRAASLWLGKRTDFWSGMAMRLKERMLEAHQVRAAAVSGNELVVLKNALLEQKADEMGFQVASYHKTRYRNVDQSAVAAGYGRGNAVDLGRGVTNGVRQIGRA